MPRHVVDVDVAAVRAHRFARNGESQTKPGTISSASFGERPKRITFGVWNSAALVLHFNVDALTPLWGAEHHAPTRAGGT